MAATGLEDITPITDAIDNPIIPNFCKPMDS